MGITDLDLLEHLVDLQLPSEIKISPSGTQIIYTLKPASKKGEHETSALWIAEVGTGHSARQLTSGLFHDRQPQWSKTGDSIAFLSDRANAGKTCAIYVLPMAGGEIYPITPPENEKAISKFEWSPDGRSICFLSPDEKSEDQKKKEKTKDDADVYGEEWEYARLRVLHVSTRYIEVLVKGDFHVADFVWNGGSKEIAFTVQRTPDRNSSSYGVEVKVVGLFDKSVHDILHFPGPVYGSLIWRTSGTIVFLAGRTPTAACTSSVIYQIDLAKKKYEHFAYGYDDDALAMCLAEDEPSGVIIAKVQKGLSDMLVFPWQKSVGHLFHDIASITAFHAVCNDGGIVYAIVTSFPSKPAELYSAKLVKMNRIDKVADTLDDLTQLSNHSSLISSLNFCSGYPFYCKADDDIELDAVFYKPSDITSKNPKLPTIVLIHGGPYSRTTLSFDLFYGWLPYLVSAGYGVLCPNYRGSSSHGEPWSSAARGAMGTKDYSDVICILKATIAEGLVHPENAIVCGWSQGGFLSYLSAVRSEFNFKGAICGAGVTDWDMLTMTSDLPWFEAELAGKAPWNSDCGHVQGRHGSAVWHMLNKKEEEKTPVLILHGKEDKRVPLTQAIAFHRGCLEHNWPCEFVVYPREEHGFVEREHILDMLKRVRRFCDHHLS